MCSTCNYKNFENMNGKLEQSLGMGSLVIRCDMSGKNYKLAVKDEYIFDFMELSEQHSERELEESLISNMRAFLEEMGGNFAFMGSQYHINVGGTDFYIDLLLYHRTLKSTF